MLLPTTAHFLVHCLAKGQAEGRAPSMTGAILRDGARVWSHGIEAAVDTQFRIGSLTKTFVAVLVMRLRDQGLLDLADPIDRHLPGIAVGSVTIGQLLSHTAGLASETPGPWWERTSGSLRPTLADALGDQPMKHPSGRRFHYSNPGFAVLGELVEAVRGRPFGEVLQQEILDPLEMARTSLQPHAPHARGYAVHPWADVLMPEVVEDVGGMAPAGALWSTVADIGRFADVLAGRAPEVLSADTAAEMCTPHAPPERGGWDAGYGLGVQLCRVGGRTLAGHTGSMPGFLCALWMTEDGRTAAVVQANTTAGIRIGALAADLVSVVEDREPAIAVPWKPMAEVDQGLLEIAGVWYWGPSAYALRLQAGGVLDLAPVSSAGGRGARFRPQSPDHFIGQNGYFHGETLTAVRDYAGRVTHLDLGSFIFTREPYDPTAPIPGGVDPDGWPTRHP